MDFEKPTRAPEKDETLRKHRRRKGEEWTDARRAFVEEQTKTWLTMGPRFRRLVDGRDGSSPETTEQRFEEIGRHPRR